MYQAAHEQRDTLRRTLPRPIEQDPPYAGRIATLSALSRFPAALLPGLSSQEAVIALQRALGNQVVQRLLTASPRRPQGIIQRGRTQPRPSPAEREKERTQKRLVGRVDKRFRTRQGKALEQLLSRDDRGAIVRKLQQDVPPTLLRRQKQKQKIYSGKWRGFAREFAKNWWDSQPPPWTCYLCRGEINPNGQGANEPSIDHVRPWAELRTEIETTMVCKDGVHWEVALVEDVRKVIQEESNLRPAHKGCNSSKNGPKNLDSLAPQRRGLCPGRGTCDLPQAE